MDEGIIHAEEIKEQINSLRELKAQLIIEPMKEAQRIIELIQLNESNIQAKEITATGYIQNNVVFIGILGESALSRKLKEEQGRLIGRIEIVAAKAEVAMKSITGSKKNYP